MYFLQRLNENIVVAFWNMKMLIWNYIKVI